MKTRPVFNLPGLFLASQLRLPTGIFMILVGTSPQSTAKSITVNINSPSWFNSSSNLETHTRRTRWLQRSHPPKHQYQNQHPTTDSTRNYPPSNSLCFQPSFVMTWLSDSGSLITTVCLWELLVVRGQLGINVFGNSITSTLPFPLPPSEGRSLTLFVDVLTSKIRVAADNPLPPAIDPGPSLTKHEGHGILFLQLSETPRHINLARKYKNHETSPARPIEPFLLYSEPYAAAYLTSSSSSSPSSESSIASKNLVDGRATLTDLMPCITLVTVSKPNRTTVQHTSKHSHLLQDSLSTLSLSSSVIDDIPGAVLLDPPARGLRTCVLQITVSHPI